MRYNKQADQSGQADKSKVILKEDPMRSIFVLILGVFFLADSAFAGCPMSKPGDKASVLVEASKALEASNPELAAKVKAIADDCCKLGLHDVDSKEASRSEHPVAPASEHPSEHPA